MTLSNPPGLRFDFLKTGSVKSIEAGPIRISLQSASPFSRSGPNLFLRKRGEAFAHVPLLGPDNNSCFSILGDAFIAQGSWQGLDYTCMLELSKKSLTWQWRVDIRNVSVGCVELDLIHVQDVGLKQASAVPVNEYYVSQYIERRILEHEKYGSVLCCRQNMEEQAGHPWLMIACKNGAESASTDGMLFYGRTFRETGIPEGLLAGRLAGEYAGESSVLALQEKPFRLCAGEVHQSVFVATYLPDHAQATSEEDLKLMSGVLKEFGDEVSIPRPQDCIAPARNLFNAAEFLPVEDLNGPELDRFFGKRRRHPETENGSLLSFFNGECGHVVLRAKETMADRPHGHILQAKAGLVPDENILSTTCYVCGVFNSHVAQGNTNFNVLLSICTSPFNLDSGTGQRIFVRIRGKWHLLGAPSAFEMGLNYCRWIYKHGDHCFQVRTWTSKTSDRVNTDFKILAGGPVNLLITHHFEDSNGWKVHPDGNTGGYLARPEKGSMIKDKFPDAQFRFIVNTIQSGCKTRGQEALDVDGKSRGGSWFVLDVPETSDFCMSIIGELRSAAPSDRIANADEERQSDCSGGLSTWKNLSSNLSLKGDQEDISAIREILPWFGMNALTHYLTPYGLEQFSGAAWGTRDVAQGPFDLLLAMEKYDAARQVLRIVFSNQNPDGGWPQWWMFDSYSAIRAADAHGDIVYWCLIALSNYIKATGDFQILEETLPYYHEKGSEYAEKTLLREHVERLIRRIIGSFIPGTAFVPFGGGDWNDSLQPVSQEMASRMISSWTVEMNFQAFMQISMIYQKAGETAKAEGLKAICERIRTDFNKHLVRDDVVAGYGLINDNGRISLLLHPQDDRTGVRYSLLPMNRGIISGIFTEDQARNHQDIIEKFLKGPDGTRLMDRPLKYRGGIQTLFRRAETSTYFGREIGLMYMHEHIRYAEALACTGRADALLKALRQAVPVAYRDAVPCGDIRQSNCYYTSSDAVFKSRYEADERYDEIKTGGITLKGGWRVYSSGPGIFIALIVSKLLGLRKEYGNVILDPVIPKSLDGFSASMDFMGRPTTFIYAVKETGRGPKAVFINGRAIEFTVEENPYRRGGAVIPVGRFLAMLDGRDNTVEIRL